MKKDKGAYAVYVCVVLFILVIFVCGGCLRKSSGTHPNTPSGTAGLSENTGLQSGSSGTSPQTSYGAGQTGSATSPSANYGAGQMGGTTLPVPTENLTQGLLGSSSASRGSGSVIPYQKIWEGKWQTTMGRYGGPSHPVNLYFTQVENRVTGTCDWQNGKVNAWQSKTSYLLIGTWSEAPSFSPPDDAGDMELLVTSDGSSFTGKWRYGSSGDWTGYWNGTRIR